MLVACSSDTTTSDGSTTNATAQATAINGSWLMTETGEKPGAKTSLLTINNGVIAGAFVDPLEGQTLDGCTYTKRRIEFSFTMSDSGLAGTFTSTFQQTGDPQSCFSYNPQVANLTGTRTTSGAGLDGEYNVTLGDEDPFVVDISNLTMKAWDQATKAKTPAIAPSMTGSVVGSSAANQAHDDELSFAATKQ